MRAIEIASKTWILFWTRAGKIRGVRPGLARVYQEKFGRPEIRVERLQRAFSSCRYGQNVPLICAVGDYLPPYRGPDFGEPSRYLAVYFLLSPFSVDAVEVEVVSEFLRHSMPRKPISRHTYEAFLPHPEIPYE